MSTEKPLIKVLYVDIETTGLDCKVNDIIQLAMIIEFDGVVQGQHEFRMCPTNGSISTEALGVTGLTLDEIWKYPLQADIFPEIIATLDKYINKFDKEDKLIPIGYNVRFDVSFLVELWRRNNNPYLGSYIRWADIDLLYLMYVYDFLGHHRLSNYKLPTVTKYYGIKHVEHDAMSDVLAVRELTHKFLFPNINWENHKREGFF